MPGPQPGPTRQAVADLTRQGLDVRTIALRLGISTQRVYQHLAKLRQTNKDNDDE